MFFPLVYNILHAPSVFCRADRSDEGVLTGEEVEKLVKHARSGDEGAFSRLVRAHWRAAYCCALSIVRAPEEARDIVQDSLLSAFSGIEGCRDPGRFSGWLLRIVRNRALNQLKRNQLARQTMRLATSDQMGRGDADFMLRDLLLTAVKCLSEQQTQVLLLHDLEGWTHAEISALLEVSEVMSRQSLFEARKKLRARLTAVTGEDSHE